MARTDLGFMFRMPPSLKARVEEAARGSGRSINAELLHRIERSFQPAPLDVDLIRETVRAVLAEMPQVGKSEGED